MTARDLAVSTLQKRHLTTSQWANGVVSALEAAGLKITFAEPSVTDEQVKQIGCEIGEQIAASSGFMCTCGKWEK